MLELTVSTNSLAGLSQARSRKQNKLEYNIIVFSDIEACGWSVSYDTIEIGSLAWPTTPLQDVL